MTYYGGRELAAAFRTVRNNTIQIAEDIPEDKYSSRATPDTMTVAQLLSHIAVQTMGAYEMHATRKMTSFEGFDFGAMIEQRRQAEAALATKSQIVKALQETRDQFAGWLEGLSDSVLGEQFAMMGPNAGTSKSRFEMLLSIKEHEMHERAKLMVIERMLGIVPHITRQREAFMAQMSQPQATR